MSHDHFSSESSKRLPLPADVSLSFGDARRGEPLSPGLCNQMQALFGGVDFSAVRVHVGSQPSQLGAEAFAHGTDLYFAPGRYCPDTPSGLSLLAHELTHVVQQTKMADGVSGSDRVPPCHRVSWIQDESMEREADDFAELAIYPRRNWNESCSSVVSAVTPADVRWDMVQANVHVMHKGDNIKLTNAGAAIFQIWGGIEDSTIKRDFLKLAGRIRPVLEEWIAASRRLWKRWIGGKKERTVKYQSYDNLARALLGEVRSQSNLEIETVLARDTENSDYVNFQLKLYLCFINDVLLKPAFSEVKKLLLPKHGKYSKEYSYFYPSGGIKKCIQEPDKVSFKNRMAAIHDIGYAFYKKKDASYSEVPDNKCMGSVLVPQDLGGYTIKKSNMLDEDDDLTFRVGSLGESHCTLLEENEIIKSARDKNMPVSFGPSFTTGRIMQCCHKMCRVHNFSDSKRLRMMGACAWGIFAFWSLHYKQKYSRIHRFHATMDMALNYELPYEPFCYPKNCPGYGDPFPMGEIIG